jgi:hypothetical protein
MIRARFHVPTEMNVQSLSVGKQEEVKRRQGDELPRRVEQVESTMGGKRCGRGHGHGMLTQRTWDNHKSRTRPLHPRPDSSAFRTEV